MDQATQAKACRILYLKSRTDPHRLNLKDDYSNIQDVALQQKKNKYLHTWISERVGNYYIKIDPEFKDCSVLKGWDTAGEAKK
jgi:peptidyl-prolyl cis-trans isomerase SurA